MAALCLKAYTFLCAANYTSDETSRADEILIMSSKMLK